MNSGLRDENAPESLSSDPGVRSWCTLGGVRSWCTLGRNTGRCPVYKKCVQYVSMCLCSRIPTYGRGFLRVHYSRVIPPVKVSAVRSHRSGFSPVTRGPSMGTSTHLDLTPRHTDHQAPSVQTYTRTSLYTSSHELGGDESIKDQSLTHRVARRGRGRSRRIDLRMPSSAMGEGFTAWMQRADASNHSWLEAVTKRKSPSIATYIGRFWTVQYGLYILQCSVLLYRTCSLYRTLGELQYSTVGTVLYRVPYM